MKNLFEKDTVAGLQQRLESLTPSSERQWGTMTVSQMLAHCSATMEMATGQRQHPRLFIGRILGPLFKAKYYNEQPLDKNSPTDKNFIIKNDPDFQKEKERLLALIHLFSNNGPEKCTTHPHSFFGKLNPQEWSRGMYKHLDHHFRQFGK